MNRRQCAEEMRRHVRGSLNTVMRGDDPRRWDVHTTPVRPRGEWLTSTSDTAKLHRFGWVFAAWAEHGTFIGGRARCGWRTTSARLFVEPPDLEICDDCLFAGEYTIYRYFDIDDALVYVGYSATASKRLDEHRRQSPWWPLVYRGTYEVFPDEASARAAEAAAIKTENPIANLPPGLNARGSRRHLAMVLSERLPNIPSPTP